MRQIIDSFICLLAVGFLCLFHCGITSADSIESHYSDYDTIEPNIHGYACVGKNGLFGLINEECEVVVPVEFNRIITFDFVSIYTDYGYCKVGNNSGTGIFSIMENKLLIPCKYDLIRYEESVTGAYFIGQKFPLETINDGWWEVYDFDIYDAEGNLQYQTSAYYVRLSNDHPGFIEEQIESESSWLGETRFIEIQPNSGNKRKQLREEEKTNVYTYEKEQALRNLHNRVFVYFQFKYYIVVDEEKASFVDIDGNELEETKITNYEYEWEAIRINGKEYDEL